MVLVRTRESTMRSLRMKSSPITRVVLVLVLGTVFLFAYLVALWHISMQCQADTASGFLHSSNGNLVDASGCELHLIGVNWFGFETSAFAPHGLWAGNWRDMFDQIKQGGFGTIRLPHPNQAFAPTPKPHGINYPLNPHLKRPPTFR